MFCILGFAQDKQVTVSLKTGTTLTGIVTEIDPASHIKMVIAGIETTLKMSDIQAIHETSGLIPDQKKQDPVTVNNLPEIYTLKVGPYEIEMALIEGNTFSMGYDGRGSVGMHSEPVHEVTLNSFYVNVKPLSEDVVDYLNGKINTDTEPDAFETSDYEKVFETVRKIARKADLPINVITEAQWEYIATTDNVFKLDIQDELNYCLDYFADYKKTPNPQIDPTGPKSGDSHVLRFYSMKNHYVHKRFQLPHNFNKTRIRFTFPASALLEKASD